MEDENKDGIPDWVNTLLGYALLLCGAIATVVTQSVTPAPRWATIMLGVCALLGGTLKVGAFNMPGTGKKQP